MPMSPSFFQRGLTTPWLFLSLGLALLAVVLGLDRWDAYRALQAQERQHLRDEAQGVAENLGSRLQTSSDALAALRADLPLLLQPDGLDQLNRRLAALVASTEGLRSLLVVDVDGTSMASNRQELIGINFRDQERYRTMGGDANPDRLYVSAPFRTPLGKWAVSLGRVVVDDQGRFNGYVLAILDPEYFRLLLSTTVYAADMRATVIHADGLVVYRAPDPEGLTGQDLRALPQSLYRRFLDSGQDRAVLEGLAPATGSERLTAFQTIQPSRTPADKPLIAAISRERSAVFAPWRQETWVRLGLFTLIALVAAVGLSAYQRRQRADACWRLAAEAERERDAERLRLATDGANLGVWYWDLVTGKLEWSNRCKEHLGLTPGQEPFFEAFYARMHPDDRGRVQALLDQAVAARSEYSAEYRVQWTDGSEHWISAPGRVYTHPDGTPRGMGGITQDITAQKRAGEEIRALNASLEQKVAARTAEANAANQAKSDFLAHMSHEIRTPMNAVLGLAQLLGREHLTDNQVTLVQRIQTAGQTLLGIINDILDFSKIEAGQLRLDTRPFDLATLLQRLDSLLAPAASAKGLVLRLSPAPTVPGPLLGDALRLEQVLINLLGNAIKFTASGEVSLTVTALDPTPAAEPAAAEPPSQRLRFAVRDTGIGMSPAALVSLFQPFTQADAGISRRFGGTGLGLSISQRLVALMGGTIQVESAEGQGSTFGFELTFAPAAALGVETPTAPVSELPAGPRLSGLRILVVDDSPMNRDLVERLLTLEGAQVTLAGDGQQAVQLLQTPSPAYDAVLMDVQMPVMDGRTATRVIRDRLGLRDLPIIALTAGVLAEEQQAIRDAGVDAVLAKPLDLEQLVATLLRLIPLATRQAAAQDASPGVAPHAGPRLDGNTSPGFEAITRPGGDANTRPRVGAKTGTAVPTSGDWPLITGIDPARAALAVGQDRAFFLNQLGRLLQDAATLVADARRALRAGDRETAARRMHSLKGNAGNLGALDLMGTASALEIAIKQSARDLETDLADLDRQVRDLAAASAPWLVEGNPTLATPAPAEARAAAGPTLPAPPLAEERLAALRAALQRHDLAAMDLFEELESLLAAVWGEAATRTLGEAIADLKFGEALAVLPPAAPSELTSKPPGPSAGGRDLALLGQPPP